MELQIFHLKIQGIDGFWDSIIEREHKRLYGDIPWNVFPIEQIYPFDGLFALGNKEQRKESIEIYYWGTKDSEICDCCGAQYRHIPWNKDWGLCPKCQAEMKQDRVSIPWIQI